MARLLHLDRRMFGSPSSTRRRRITTLGRATFAIALVALVGGVVFASRGTLDTWNPDGRSRPPAWAQPCFGAPARHERDLLHMCSRVAGRTLWVQGEPSEGEVHFALITRKHLVIVKTRVFKPSFGDHVEAIGPMVRASNGQREVDARSVLGT